MDNNLNELIRNPMEALQFSVFLMSYLMEYWPYICRFYLRFSDFSLPKNFLIVW